jgi:hypothetical protein
MLRCPFRRNALSWHPGHRMHRRSLRVPRCGHLPASRPPLQSTRSSRLSANSMAAPAIRLAASPTVCVRRLGSWPPSEGTPWTRSIAALVHRFGRGTARLAQMLEGRPRTTTPSDCRRSGGAGRIVTAADVGPHIRARPGLTTPAVVSQTEDRAGKQGSIRSKGASQVFP